MKKYSELPEERKEQIRKYQREYQRKHRKKNWNKRNPEKSKEYRERWKKQHLDTYEKQRKKNRLDTFFKFYNACENKNRAFITKDMAEILKISREYATEITTEAKKRKSYYTNRKTGK